MILKTTEFQKACSAILPAVSNGITNLELSVKNNFLYLTVTNKSYYCSVKFALSEPEDLHATVSAQLFLNLIANITSETVELVVKDNVLAIKAGGSRSSYKLPMIYEGDTILTLPPIRVTAPTVDMTISSDILSSIYNINGKELLKAKFSDLNEAQRLYYFTDTGCFTYTTGACINTFSLPQPVAVTLTDQLVKLFKLFKSDVRFMVGHDVSATGMVQTKVVFTCDNIYLAAITPCDDAILNKLKRQYEATQRFAQLAYPAVAVLPTAEVLAAINRLTNFSTRAVELANKRAIIADVVLNADEFIIMDNLGNIESIPTANGSTTEAEYTMQLNLVDLELVLKSCKADHITLSCGNGTSVFVSRGTVTNILPEYRATN